MPATPSCSSVSDHFRFQPIQSSEVLSALKGLDTRKSAGPDSIPVLFLHQVAEEIAEPLSYIYNHSLNTAWYCSFSMEKIKYFSCAQRWRL